MLHIVRKNESITDIARIYKATAESISNANNLDEGAQLYENSSIWVPKDKYVRFTQSAITTEIENDYPFANTCIKENTRIEDDYMPLNINTEAIFKITRDDAPFVTVDLYARELSAVYLNVYDVNEKELNLPNDYPAINACEINDVKPGFIIDNADTYLDEYILQQLLYDLSFKSYKKALLIINNENETHKALALKKALGNEGYPISIAAPANVLTDTEFKGFDTVYYKTEDNIFDFEGFKENIDKLMSRYDILGVLYEPKGADIDKSNQKIKILKNADIYKVISANDIKKISFDDRSQLCYTGYESDGIVHNILFEDLRSFYAKANYLIQNNINTILFNELNNTTLNYIGVLKQLEYNLNNK